MLPSDGEIPALCIGRGSSGVGERLILARENLKRRKSNCSLI
jgi:hypothetical protein